MANLSRLDKMANKVNKCVKSPKKQSDTSGKKAYGDAGLVSAVIPSKKRKK